MIKKALFLAPLMLAVGCATVATDEEPSPLPSLKSTYMSSGLMDDDFTFDLVLGTRLAGIEYCNAGDLAQLSPVDLSAKRLAIKNRTPSNLSSIRSTMSQTIGYAKNQSEKFYVASGKERACDDEHMALLKTNYDNFKSGNVEAFADMKKVYLPKSREYTKQRPTNGLLNSGITQAGL